MEAHVKSQAVTLRRERKPMGRGGALAYATMLMPREKLIAMHATTDHDQIDELMSELLQVGEDLKDTAQMLESAYVRILATACAHAVAGGKFPSTSA